MVLVPLSAMMLRRRQALRSAAAGQAESGVGGGDVSAGNAPAVDLWAVPLPRRVAPTPLGPVLIAASDVGLAGLWFQGQRHGPAAAWGSLAPAGNTDRDGNTASHAAAHAILGDAEAQLEAYFRGQRLTFDLPLDLRHGTPFQRQVWQALCEIPAGDVVGYAQLAARVGAPKAARAVGAAVGRNPVSVIVPCHRVVGAQGALTGYAGGLERKRALLRLEGPAA